MTTNKAIDPATGDYWKSNQPEYWECAAQSWRDIETFSARQETQKVREIENCENRARALRHSQP